MPDAARHRLPEPPRRRLRWARVVLAVLSTALVAVSGAAWWTTRGVLTGFTVSHALADSAHVKGGPINILLIGLDSRKDQHGNDLPQEVLDQLHAGDSETGGYNTNTLILVHVDADNKVTAFSIPRDDYIDFHRLPGYTNIKIKEAYGLTKFYTEQHLADEGIGDRETLEMAGREAGRAATLGAVRSLVGVPIDYFAEINLAGFYDLASTLGGIQVCLNHAVDDEYSGANFPAGHQTLNAAQALAFVRQRHGLENGDLDRTHRQQAFLVAVMRQLQESGAFTDIGKLNELMAIAHKDIVLSSGWDSDLFRRLGSISGQDVVYKTLPVVRYDTRNGQDVNIIDPDAIKAQVRAAFSNGNAATTAPTTAEAVPTNPVQVVNADSNWTASTVATALEKRGFHVETPDIQLEDKPALTTISYGAGADDVAEQLSGLLGAVVTVADKELPAGQVRVVIGNGYLVPAKLTAQESTSSTSSTTPSSSAARTATTSAHRPWFGTEEAGSSDPTPDHGLPVSGDRTPCVN
ncbi:LCP family protein [Mycolicibacterium fluoranthenivorans]|uniref:LCP family protein required for cell wall assembly n=1 Tax=Mycolicibacterium fluoranthenivorans TaxID=258505 RepID=A0A7X5U6F5_9MYCO|nr:LCP family protein [Mycolicibacterium fluoranthenivorans]MCV7356383.1 LCP family protein [Mycolicibacterium fluoranthenivorans]NIH99233.1 LCP family protein required for cell wall assembly [Mycolicibacterium fluoranthenivorans]